MTTVSSVRWSVTLAVDFALLGQFGQGTLPRRVVVAESDDRHEQPPLLIGE
nr:hypothetical protein [Haloplanus salinus]